ncbi:hypothetical protein HNY73_016373 [Argiope bruennichi]|uniref:Uncharacterized protein n=1 Tax=Argiope bruennichi TaxID=94029 RepID=A0A8T0EIM1_ARGBR|nr:hypothetical protein HNY73_016373 [Argiope bruennichi]
MPETGDIPKDPNREISEFGGKVFCYSLQKFGIIFKEVAHSSRFTEDIGNAVVILQLHIRDFLRDHLFRGVEKMMGVIDTNQRFQAMQHLLDLRSDQALENYSINTLFLGYLALISELIIFMDSAGIPTQMDYFKRIWTEIYDARLKQKFAEGWEDLKKEAKRICDECPRKEEIFKELIGIEHPYAEIDPRLETSYTELDPIFMFCTLGTGFEFPRKPGLSREAMKTFLQERSLDNHYIYA